MLIQSLVVASRPVEQQVVPRMEAIKGVWRDTEYPLLFSGTVQNSKAGKYAAQNGQATRQQTDFQYVETQRPSRYEKLHCARLHPVNPHQGFGNRKAARPAIRSLKTQCKGSN